MDPEILDLPAEIHDEYVIMSVESSAISQISFDYRKKEIGITYHNNPDKSYIFLCEDPVDVEEQVRSADSIGRLIAHLKSEEILQYKPY